ncbi:hypothetical protein KC19_4G182000 [Ceratodon purpureus]|uniref:Uncharacterized protein n=1 Tax=Ceratodon purpureus TaxID=3225 RepID=A0A8T0IC41_CERPU|nr:hypothetical protein KC19_4G182000 [Ceratodon purpureus]
MCRRHGCEDHAGEDRSMGMALKPSGLGQNLDSSHVVFYSRHRFHDVFRRRVTHRLAPSSQVCNRYPTSRNGYDEDKQMDMANTNNGYDKHKQWI